jgi:Protein of unknown function (DUF2370)
MIIDDMPTGSLWVFTAYCMISFFFQFVGFLLTYLLHTSHAGKYGSRAGLGITLIQFGFYSRSATFSPDPSPDGAQLEVEKPKNASTPAVGDDELLPTVSSKDWLAFLFMTLGMLLLRHFGIFFRNVFAFPSGWFLLLSSVIGFWRVKRWERSIRSVSSPISPEEIERDIAMRRNLETAFGISFAEEENRENRAREAYALAQEQRLTRDLRAAGLI